MKKISGQLGPGRVLARYLVRAAVDGVIEQIARGVWSMRVTPGTTWIDAGECLSGVLVRVVLTDVVAP